jgi:hypothetical protein
LSFSLFRTGLKKDPGREQQKNAVKIGRDNYSMEKNRKKEKKR